MLSDAGKLSIANGVGYLINLVGGLILARILSPALYGVWKNIQLTVQYTAYSHFGATLALGKLCPGRVSRNRTAEYSRLMHASFAFSFTVGSIVGALILLGAVFVPPGPWRVGMLSLVFLVPIQQIYTHADLALTFEKKFGIKAWQLFITTTARVLLSLALALKFDLAGALAAYVATLLWNSVVMWRRSDLPLAFRPNFALVRRLIRVGLPFTAITFGEMVLATADKWLVAAMVSATDNGIYQMAFYALPVVTLIPTSLRQVYVTEVLDIFERTKDLRKVWPVYCESVYLLSLSTPLVIGAVFFGVPWLIERFLHTFIPAVPSTRVFAIVYAPMLLVHTSYSLLVLMRRSWQGFLLQLLVASCCTAATCLLFAFGFGTLERVLYVFGTGWFLFATYLLVSIRRAISGEESLVGSIFQTLKFYGPLAFGAAAALGLQWGLARGGLDATRWFFGPIAGAIYVLMCVPFVLALEKRTHAISAIRRRVSGLFGRR